MSEKVIYPPHEEREAEVESRVRAIDHGLDTDNIFETVQSELEDMLDEVILEKVVSRTRDTAYLNALYSILITECRYVHSNGEYFTTSQAAARNKTFDAFEKLLLASAALSKRLNAPVTDMLRGDLALLGELTAKFKGGKFPENETKTLIEDFKKAKKALAIECKINETADELWGEEE